MHKNRFYFFGFVAGMFLTAVSTLLYLRIMLPEIKLLDAFLVTVNQKLLTKVLTLGTLPNVGLFWMFILNHKIYLAKGVLMFVFITALWMIFYNFV